MNSRILLIAVAASIVVAFGAVAFIAQVDGGNERPREDPTRGELRALLQAAELYRAEEGLCPESATDLVVGGYADGALDPWGTPYRIDCSDDRVQVFSSGPDRVAETSDDQSVP